jgi:hypothetical protein
LTLDEAAVAQDPSVYQRDGHQTVSVTLFRYGGRSGSWPRATDRAFTMR